MCDDVISKVETENLVDALESFNIFLGIVIWHDILFAINMVSKKLQDKPYVLVMPWNKQKIWCLLRNIEMMDLAIVWTNGESMINY